MSEQSEAKKGFAVYEVGKGIVGTLLREQTGRLEALDRLSLVPRGRSVYCIVLVANVGCRFWHGFHVSATRTCDVRHMLAKGARC